MCGVATKRPDESPALDQSLFTQTLAERLHDGPLQELVALQLKAANLARFGVCSADDQLERLVELGNLAQAAIDHLHDLIRELTEDAAEPLELFPRLVDLCEQFTCATGIECDVQLAQAHMRFGPAVSDVVYRTVRELLANVRKHAQATEVRITSSRRADGAITISVADNGIGMPVVSRRGNPFQGGGFGLWSIEHRLGEFGARLELDGDAGLCATIVVPRGVVLTG
jgi:signal transduction histidine kinase